MKKRTTTWLLAVFIIIATILLSANAPALSWTSTTPEDYNTGTGFDFNWTKVTGDANVMPTGSDRIYVETDQAFYDENLMLYVRFDDTNVDGSGVLDDTNNDNDGLLCNGGDINGSGLWDTNAFFSDGVNDVIDFGDPNMFEGIPELTVIVWARWNKSLGTGNWEGLVQQCGGGADVFAIYVSTSERFVFNVKNADQTSTTVNGDFLGYIGNDWAQHALVFGDGNVSVYENGFFYAKSPLTGVTGTSGNTLKIGGKGVCTNPWPGDIDEVKIYNRALTAQEIQQDYNAWYSATYTSPVKDAGGAANWDTIRWLEDTDMNNSLTVDYRGCSTSNCSTAGDWQTGLSGGNTEHSTINADNNQYFQYRVNFDTNDQAWNPYRKLGAYQTFASFYDMTVTYTLANAAPDLNIWQAIQYDVNYPFSGGILTWFGDQNITIDFNVFDSDNDRLTVDINYNTEAETGTPGIPIITDLNLTSAVCSDQDWADSPSLCKWDWNGAAADGNYYIIIEIDDGTTTDFNISDSNIGIDASAPTTVENATIDGNNTWQNTDANIQFSCSDVNAGCKNFYYKLNDVNYQKGWGDDLNIGIVLDYDYNHEIWFWSGDLVDNNETLRVIYVAVDKSTPATVDNDFNTTYWQNTDANIQFSCTDVNAGCKNFYYSLNDVNYQFGWGYDLNIGVVLNYDYNHEIFYWSDNNTSGVADNNATAKLIFMAIDKEVPTLKATDQNNLWQNTDANILVECSDVNAGCKNLYYGVVGDANYQLKFNLDLNVGIELTTDGNWHIWYWADDNTTGIGDNNSIPTHFYIAIDKTTPDCTEFAVYSTTYSGYYKDSDTVHLEVACDATDLNVMFDLYDIDDQNVVDFYAVDDGDNNYSLDHIVSASNALANGLKTVSFNACDAAGNCDTTPTDTITLNNTGPSPAGPGPGSTSEALVSRPSGGAVAEHLPPPEAVPCSNDTDCESGYRCVSGKCAKFFDVKILRADTPIKAGQQFDFTYLLRNPFGKPIDAEIEYWLEKNSKKVMEGREVVL